MPDQHGVAFAERPDEEVNDGPLTVGDGHFTRGDDDAIEPRSLYVRT